MEENIFTSLIIFYLQILMLLELIRGAKKFTMFLSQGVFGRVDFRENGKKRRKNEEGKIF